MKKILISFWVAVIICTTGAVHAVDESFFSCGPGYILETVNKVDGLNTAECRRLWCRDLDLGKNMGNGNTAAGGYKITNAPVELCDAENNCVECFGDRKWCSGEPAGVWNPEYGVYTRGGDNLTYLSYLKGSCFAWRLEKPNCPDGQTAILRSGAWICATATGTTTGSRESSIRRTGTIRRVIP